MLGFQCCHQINRMPEQSLCPGIIHHAVYSATVRIGHAMMVRFVAKSQIYGASSCNHDADDEKQLLRGVLSLPIAGMYAHHPMVPHQLRSAKTQGITPILEI